MIPQYTNAAMDAAREKDKARRKYTPAQNAQNSLAPGVILTTMSPVATRRHL